MLSSYFNFDLLGVVGLIVIKILLFLIEFAFYGASLLCIFFIIKGFIKIPEIMGKIFILMVMGIAAFICLSLGHTISLIDIEQIFKI